MLASRSCSGAGAGKHQYLRLSARRRSMGRIGIAFLVGVCCVHSLAALPGAMWAAALLVAFVIAVIARAQLLCVLLLGFSWAWLHAAARLAGDLPAALEGEDLRLIGAVASLPEISAGDRQFTLEVLRAPVGTPSRIRLAWFQTRETPRPGEVWRLTVRLKRRNGFANPGGFDYEAHLFRDGVGATGYVRADPANARVEEAGRRYPTTQARAWLADRLAAALPSSEMLGVVQGLALGDTREMRPEQWRVFAATGTTHLMAISGLHITMIAALVASLGGFAVRWRGAQSRGWNALEGRALAGGCAALAYSALAGLSVPTQRTLVMLGVYFLARWRRRELSGTHALGLALVGVLVLDPFAPLAVGAWLSFGAVAVILLATSGRLVRDSALASFTRVQAALTFGLAPLLLAAFGGISLVAPLANAVAVPFFTLLLVPAVLVGALVTAFSVRMGSILLAAPVWLLEATWPVLEQLAQHPLATWRAPQPTPWVFAALAAGAFLLVAPGLWMMRAAGVLLCLPVAVNRPPAPAQGDFQVAVLDVGQGLATVVRTRSHTLVYDAGPAFQSGRDTGELVIAPYLHHQGVRAIDRLVISHDDLDHRGGLRSLAAALPIRSILRGPSVRGPSLHGMAAEVCHRGQGWVWDGVEFIVLHPAGPQSRRENDSSCVLRIRGRGGSVLLTGDIEADAEAALAASGLTHADLVVAPHHGSRTSSTPDLVDALRPQVVVFSAGYRNRWGFPKDDVVRRWRATGALALSTAASGAVEATVAADTPIRISEHRRAAARYWRRQG
jgi:competence protein ComEC